MFTVTYTPDFEIVLTRRCSFACGYCNFPSTPSPLPPSRRALKRLLRRASRLGCSQVTLTAGEGIDRLPEIANVCRYYGHESWWDYIGALCAQILAAPGPRPLMPVINAGALPNSEMRRLGEVTAAVRLLIDSGDERLLKTEVHGHSPHKDPTRRLAALEDLGRAGMTVTTGIRVGIGGRPEYWTKTARIVSGVHVRHGNIQNFVIQPFNPAPFSAMALHPPVADGTLIRAVASVREALDPSIPLTLELQGRMHLAAAAIRAGTSDFGAVRLGSSERVIEVDALAELDDARHNLGELGIHMEERPAIFPDVAAQRQLPRSIREQMASWGPAAPHTTSSGDNSVFG